MKIFRCIFILLSALSLAFAGKPEKVIILIQKEPTGLEQYTAKELRRYIYLRTGEMPIIISKNDVSGIKDNTIIVAKPGSKLFTGLKGKVKTYNDLTEQEYFLITFDQNGKKNLVITGGDDQGILYGAYRFLELLGIRFYLHDDVVPDKKIKFVIPDINERRRPLFALRGILPFHDFPEGPDLWNQDEYKSIFTQMTKLKMNFIGLHTYMDVPYTAEPTIWVGTEKDVLENGNVKYSYPASYYNTLRENYIYAPRKTGDFLFGCSKLFEKDIYGPDVMNDVCPKPATLEKCNELFNRTGLFYKNVFDYAKIFNIKTCIGTDVPLFVVDSVQKRAKGNREITQQDLAIKIYEGVFNRIKKSFPLDYYWLWIPENWTWSGASDSTINEAKDDLFAAIQAGKNQNIPFQLATCGWVLGPPNDRAMFDKELPKNIPFSCINREVGFAKVDAAFKNIADRQKWAIPWFEDDAATANPQLWVRRVRRDALDALKYGCSGLMGLHWRVKVLSPTINALAYAAWDQSGWDNPPAKLKDEYKLPGPVGGRYSYYYDHPINNSREDSVYQSIRQDLLSYNFKLPNGKYKVTLKFCEMKHDAPNKRIFNVLMQGKTILNKLDIYAKAGKDCAIDFTFNDIEVNNGWLDIEFVKEIDLTCISGIVIEGNNYIKKINCGGEKYKDYDADWYIYEPDQTPISSKDFYQDWALNQFGPEAGKFLGDVFEKIDGRLPRPTDWVDGPGNIKADPRKWEEVEKEYEFINEMDNSPKISGAGNIERYNYWRDNFLYMKNLSKLNCQLAEFDNIIINIKGIKDSAERINTAKQTALPLRIKMVGQLKEIYKYFIRTISTPGEIGSLLNMEQHILTEFHKKTGKYLDSLLGGLPKEAIPTKEYSGQTRVILPTTRTAIAKDEELEIQILILSEKFKKINFFLSGLGANKFIELPVTHIARGVYSVKINPKQHNNMDFEYYIKAVDEDNKETIYPVTAPDICRTVICN
jgi:hypothetical protein